jgi:hypothetical protein
LRIISLFTAAPSRLRFILLQLLLIEFIKKVTEKASCGPFSDIAKTERAFRSLRFIKAKPALKFLKTVISR